MSKISDLLEYLKTRNGEPIKLVPLAKELNSCTSTVSAAVHSLRQKGYNITCDKNNGGYVFHDKPKINGGKPVIPPPDGIAQVDSTLTSQIIQYMSNKKSVTSQQLIDDLKIKRSSLYALISQIRKNHKIYTKNGAYYYVGPKVGDRGTAEMKRGTDSLEQLLSENCPGIKVSDIMRVPEQERPELLEAIRKITFYRKVALAMVDTAKITESITKGVRI